MFLVLITTFKEAETIKNGGYRAFPANNTYSIKKLQAPVL
jgi:hypothetical protein